MILGKTGRELAAVVGDSGVVSDCKIDVALPKIVLGRDYGHKGAAVEVS